MYDNEPLTGITTDPVRQQEKTTTQHYYRMVSQARIHSNGDKISAASLSAVRLPLLPYDVALDERSLSYLKSLIRRHPLSFSRTGSTTFIHPGILISPILGDIQYLLRTLTAELPSVDIDILSTIPPNHLFLLNETIISLLSTIPTLKNYMEILQFIQGLILIQILTLFIIPAHILPDLMFQQAQNRQALLERWTWRLWESAPSVLPSYLSSHQVYFLGESVRRTLLVSHELLALWHVVKHGYFVDTVHVASLPFDRRIKLWDLDGEQFKRLIDNDIDRGVQSSYIVSYREYCDMYDHMAISRLEGQFGAMLLVGAKGLDDVEKRFEMNLNLN